ncbi:Reverse transcriptase RNA-dependent DNA polymerase [Arabidopsis thaliana x Arabidopsis arenosa]|uniref:Reverse transcriptase RNA-dependent DNA polymerase n=1 Tax=Arabidopsis thaliana x Arabidopsis arenosa TaxID=1240361 RepID=A0A8T2CZY6_9BRAS|nr:Reverse transcriptase RNA-dependent DNA polymerase [Arabidopsis thaliana x Arabidopsis arenosa]
MGQKIQKPNAIRSSPKLISIQRLPATSDKYRRSAEQSVSSDTEVTTRNHRNYLLWKSQFESFLSGQGLFGFVTGSISVLASTIPVPHIEGHTNTVANPDYEAWHRSDQVVKAWLLGSLSEDILSVVVGSKTSQEVWLNLVGHFNRISASRVFELQRRLHGLSKEGKTMDEYLRCLKTICDQLASVGSLVTEKMKIFAMVHGLTREYEPLITSLENTLDTFPGPTYAEIMHRLKGFDDRMQSYNTTDVSPHLAFGTFNNQGRGKGSKGRGRRNYSTRGRGFQQQFPSSGSQSSSPSERPTCQICGKRGHPALQCWYRFDESYQHSEAAAAAFSALHITDFTDDGAWVPDSAATAHITNNGKTTENLQLMVVDPISVTPLQMILPQQRLSRSDEQRPECTASLDLDPIGNSVASSSSDQEQSTSDVIKTTESTHPMVTRSKTGISKPNKRIKLLADGSLDKYKSRLVAQGFNQEEGIDYLETYSPVVRSATVRAVLHLATIMNWELKQMDVKNAFLHGDLTETVYMKQPADFINKALPNHKMHAPTLSDFHLLKRILRYVKGTTTMGISFNKDTDCKLRAYSDSDHAGCHSTRRSTGGFCTFLGNNLISWSSRKQPTVAKSSTEVEYRAMSETVSEITWIVNLLKDLSF